jgi:hypothetical protein
VYVGEEEWVVISAVNRVGKKTVVEIRDTTCNWRSIYSDEEEVEGYLAGKKAMEVPTDERMSHSAYNHPHPR